MDKFGEYGEELRAIYRMVEIRFAARQPETIAPLLEYAIHISGDPRVKLALLRVTSRANRHPALTDLWNRLFDKLKDEFKNDSGMMVGLKRE